MFRRVCYVDRPSYVLEEGRASCDTAALKSGPRLASKTEDLFSASECPAEHRQQSMMQLRGRLEVETILICPSPGPFIRPTSRHRKSSRSPEPADVESLQGQAGRAEGSTG